MELELNKQLSLEIKTSNGKKFTISESFHGDLQIRMDCKPYILQIKPVCSNIIEVS